MRELWEKGEGRRAATGMSWLARSLDGLGLDGAEFAAFIVSCLEEEQDLTEFMSNLGLAEAERASLQGEILERWRVDRESFFFFEQEQEQQMQQEQQHREESPPVIPRSDEEPTVHDDVGEEAEAEQEESAEWEAGVTMERQLEVLGQLDAILGEKFSIEAIYCAVAAAEDASASDVALWVANSSSLLRLAEEACVAARPCRHALQGSCLRADCAFDHDLSQSPCRFWLLQQGGCILVDSPQGCRFAHGWDVFLKHLDSLPRAPLHQHHGSLAGCGDGYDGSAFPPLSAGPVGAAGVGSSGNYRAALAKAGDDSSWKRGGGQGRQPPGDRPRGSGGGTAATASVSVARWDWVDSGGNVAQLYSEMREEARVLAIARNKMLEAATQAFRAGDGAQARALSAKGRELCDAMHSKHQECAKAIFASRNPRARLQSGVVDLHGLHCAEAEALLLDGGLLDSLRTSFGLRHVDVVTGTGNHTLGPQKGRARLLPTVEAVMRDLGLTFSVIKDPQGFVGGVRVSLG